MQTGGWRGDRTAHPGKDGLIPLSVRAIGWALDIRRKRYLADRVDDGVDNSWSGGVQSDCSTAVKMPLQHLEMQLVIPFAKNRSGPDVHLLPWVDQDIPAILIKSGEEQALDGAAARVAPAKEARREHPRVVDDQEVARSQETWQFIDSVMGPGLRDPVEVQETRPIARR